MKKPNEQPIATPPESKSVHWLRVHAGAALRIALGASFAVFVSAIFLSFSSQGLLIEERKAAEQELASEQKTFDKRLAAMEVSNATVKRALEDRITVLSDKQLETNARDVGSPVRSPFPLEKVMRSIVEIICIDNVDQQTYYTGSGTVVDDGGTIVTNHHLLMSEDGSIIKYCGIGFTTDLQKPPDINYIAAVLAIHTDADLAILHITETVDETPLPMKFPAITLEGAAAASLALNLGDPVYIGGYPNIGADTFTFTQGVVSGRVGPTFIKTSAIIDTGASGGAAFDSGGRYIGVPTAAAKGEIGSSLGYLIGSDVVDTFLIDFYGKKRKVSRPVE